ncbi:hypothetical protein [Salinithrix halophila]|uniref:Uncharacterized protein n=1 Tax=Salinithrix halophila TaxID=1485204 RepID=A0ABV8JA11_9BACL
MQEWKLKRPLPPGAGEVLKRLQHEQLPPVLDVFEERDYVVVVHPPLSGEPLSLLVRPGEGMALGHALTVYRSLLRAAVQFSHLPLPLTVTLDPQNIVLEGTRPYFLFFGFRHFILYPPDEQWRFLLYYLLTGKRMDREGMDHSGALSSVPGPVKDLLFQALDSAATMEQVLESTEWLLQSGCLHEGRKKEGLFKKWRYGLAATIVVFLGFWWGCVVSGGQGEFDRAKSIQEKQPQKKESPPLARERGFFAESDPEW